MPVNPPGEWVLWVAGIGMIVLFLIFSGLR